jgi:hypothetical protein
MYKISGCFALKVLPEPFAPIEVPDFDNCLFIINSFLF